MLCSATSYKSRTAYFSPNAVFKRENCKHQLANNKKCPNSKFQWFKNIWNLINWNLRFICYLGFVTGDLNDFIFEKKIYKNNPFFINYLRDTTLKVILKITARPYRRTPYSTFSRLALIFWESSDVSASGVLSPANPTVQTLTLPVVVEYVWNRKSPVFRR